MQAHMRIGLVAVLLGMLALSGCVDGRGASDEPQRLAPDEVREYEGERLDSIDDFRENSIKGPQEIDIDEYRLKIEGLVSDPLSLSYEQVLDRQSYEKVVRLDCVEGWGVDILWEGVLLEDLLVQAGYDEDAATLIFECEDGYSTSLPLDFITRKDILLAYRMNGVDLPTERGYPFQVVAQDKWGYKWAKWVTRIEVSDDESYQGYWEQRGYDNEADLPSASGE